MRPYHVSMTRLAAALLLGLGLPLLAQAPSATQSTKIDAGPVSVPLTVREEYLGKSGEKTVVRFRLSMSKAEVRAKLNAAPRVYTFTLVGESKDAAGKVLETFHIPIDLDLSEAEASKPLAASFLKALPPGPQVLQLRVEGVTGNAVAMRAIDLVVPTMQGEFRAEDAGLDTAGQPTAMAVILESENQEKAPSGPVGDLVKILAPKKEVPVGLLRVDCEVKPPVTRVEFFLEEKKILVRNRAPYTVELDLGNIPKKQTLKAIGFDRLGNYVDSDAWAINERDARLAVRILELPSKLGDVVELKVTVQSIAGGVAKGLKLFADNTLLKEWTAPPYTATVPAEKLKKATLLRATALDEEGKEFSDVKFLKGESRFLSKVEVNLVELNISVLDADRRFVKGLKEADFTVLEDGVVQKPTSFEFAESLPISLGIVIDGSGSMKDSMPLVHQAATEFIEKLVATEKDQGFVMEFREGPLLLSPMTHRKSDLVRAIAETSARGATALYDSVVMALYQFRSVPGRKALVILTDGKDNHSHSDYDIVRRYARSAGVPVFFIGLDLSFLEVGLKSKMNELAADTGAEAFFVGNAKGLPEIYRKIETELRSQYFLRYLTESKKPEEEFRAVEVRLKDPKLRAKTIRGYFP